MNKEELMQLLPHREQMLLIDEAHVEGSVAYGKKKITGEEFFLKGHFPGNPIVPGVILCEILAQSACVLLPDIPGSVIRFLTGLEKVRFKNPVKPGDTVETECEITKNRSNFYWIKGRGYVNKKLCISAELTIAVADA